MGWNFAIQLLANPFVIHDDTKKCARKPRITVNSNCSSKFTATSFSTLSPILEHTGTAANLYTMTRRSVLFFLFCSWTPTNLYTVSIQTASLSLFQMKMLFVKKKVEVSSAFRLLVGRWKTTSVVGKNAKNSTDRKLTRRNSTEATIRNLTHNTIKKHVWPPLKLIGCLCVHLICQFSQQNAKKTELACPLAKN